MTLLRAHSSTAWWLSTFPGIAITLTILVANFAGDWVMTLIDPTGRRSWTRFRALGGLRTSLPTDQIIAGPTVASEETA